MNFNYSSSIVDLVVYYRQQKTKVATKSMEIELN